jgi:hypothetical protein
VGLSFLERRNRLCRAARGRPLGGRELAAFLANARTWADARASEAERAQASREIERDLPALRALGLLDVLDIRDDALRAFVEAAWR